MPQSSQTAFRSPHSRRLDTDPANPSPVRLLRWTTPSGALQSRRRGSWVVSVEAEGHAGFGGGAGLAGGGFGGGGVGVGDALLVLPVGVGELGEVGEGGGGGAGAAKAADAGRLPPAGGVEEDELGLAEAAGHALLAALGDDARRVAAHRARRPALRPVPAPGPSFPQAPKGPCRPHLRLSAQARAGWGVVGRRGSGASMVRPAWAGSRDVRRRRPPVDRRRSLPASRPTRRPSVGFALRMAVPTTRGEAEITPTRYRMPSPHHPRPHIVPSGTIPRQAKAGPLKLRRRSLGQASGVTQAPPASTKPALQTQPQPPQSSARSQPRRHSQDQCRCPGQPPAPTCPNHAPPREWCKCILYPSECQVFIRTKGN